MRLVDADAAIDALKEYFNDEDQKDTEYGAYWHHSHVLKVLESLPTAQPKKGKWEDRSFTGLHRYRCDQCGGLSYFADNFCPNCGADMRR